jgi:mono/diheme cytochrome c family protein
LKRTITEGVAHPKQYGGVMPPMGGAQLTPEQLSAVAAYVWALGHR